MREHLKLQQELFISFLVDRLVRPVGNSSMHARKGEMESELDASTWNIDDSSNMVVTPQRSSHLLTPTSERRSSGSLTQSVGPSSSNTRYQPLPGSESRDLMLEYLVHFARAPDFMTNLWINYDCNVDCEDLFERLIKFFSRVGRIASCFP
jgi:brefeldin A-resistance guanine nucleotide exchange factor 1